MKIATGVAFATAILAGCAASGDSATLDVSQPPAPAANVGATPPGAAGEEDAPKVMAAGTSPIRPELQAAFCKDQVAFMYDAEPQDAVAQERVVAADGSATVDVVIDKGSGGRKTYVCSLGADNRFVGVTAAGAGLL